MMNGGRRLQNSKKKKNHVFFTFRQKDKQYIRSQQVNMHNSSFYKIKLSPLNFQCLLAWYAQP